MVDKLQIPRNGCMSTSVPFNEVYCWPGERCILSNTNYKVTWGALLVDLLSRAQHLACLSFFSSLFGFSLPFITSTSFLSTYFVPNKLKYASEFVIVLAVQTFFFSISDKILNSIYAAVFSQMWQIILIVILIGEGMPGRLLKCISQCACSGVCRDNWPVELTRKEAFCTRAAPSTSLH